MYLRRATSSGGTRRRDETQATPRPHEASKKFYGNRGNLVHPEAIRCEVHFEERIHGEGTFVGDGFVIAIPVN